MKNPLGLCVTGTLNPNRVNLMRRVNGVNRALMFADRSRQDLTRRIFVSFKMERNSDARTRPVNGMRIVKRDIGDVARARRVRIWGLVVPWSNSPLLLLICRIQLYDFHSKLYLIPEGHVTRFIALYYIDGLLYAWQNKTKQKRIFP